MWALLRYLILSFAKSRANRAIFRVILASLLYRYRVLASLARLQVVPGVTVRGCHVKGIRVKIRYFHLLEIDFLLILQY